MQPRGGRERPRNLFLYKTRERFDRCQNRYVRDIRYGEDIATRVGGGCAALVIRWPLGLRSPSFCRSDGLAHPACLRRLGRQAHRS